MSYCRCSSKQKPKFVGYCSAWVRYCLKIALISSSTSSCAGVKGGFLYGECVGKARFCKKISARRSPLDCLTYNFSNNKTIVHCDHNAGCIFNRVGTQPHGGILPPAIPGKFPLPCHWGVEIRQWRGPVQPAPSELTLSLVKYIAYFMFHEINFRKW